MIFFQYEWTECGTVKRKGILYGQDCCREQFFKETKSNSFPSLEEIKTCGNYI